MYRLVLIVVFAACGGVGSSMDSEWHQAGECEPADDAVELAVEVPAYRACDGIRGNGLGVVESAAGWGELFECGDGMAPAIDFATQRAAVAQADCSPISLRFAAEDADEVVVGIHQSISGACLGKPLIVPLPRSVKPVRLAVCRDECSGYCPPVP